MIKVQHWLATAMTTLGALCIWGMGGCTVSAGIGVGACNLDDDPCSVDSDCCSYLCVGDGYCAPSSCVYQGDPCDYDTDCCGGYCGDDGYACLDTGDYCDYDDDCCSGYCDAGYCY